MRKFVHNVMTHNLTNAAVLALIIVSIVLVVVETACNLPHDSTAGKVSDVLTFVFIGELTLRFIGFPTKIGFFREYWLDIIACMPVLPALRIFRISRLIRLLRILRLVRAGLFIWRREWLSGRSGEYLLMAILIVMTILFGASASFHFEHGSNPVFKSFSDALWYNVYTIIAGQPSEGPPTTGCGKAVVLMVMFSGTLFFALFVGLVAAFATDAIRKRGEVREMSLQDLEDHVVICGWNRTGNLVVEQLQTSEFDHNKAIVIVAELEQAPAFAFKGVKHDLIYFISDDFTKSEALRKANVPRAATVIILADDTRHRSDQDRDARTVLAALTVEKLKPGIYTCAELLSKANEEHLRMAGVEQVIVPNEYSGYLLASVARHAGLEQLVDMVLSSESDNHLMMTKAPPAFVGKTFGFAAIELKNRYEILLVGIKEYVGGGPTDTTCSGRRSFNIVVNPPAGRAIAATDELIIIASRMPKF